MAKPRRKAPRLEAPTTTNDAAELIGRYLRVTATIEAHKLETIEAHRQIDEIRAILTNPLEEEAKALFLQLRTWWAVAANELTDGKRKSVELAGAQIGERTTPPALKLPTGMTADDAVAIVKALGLDYTADALRIKATLDKAVLVKLLLTSPHAAPAEQLAERGFTVVQRDEFFIVRVGSEDPDPAIIAEETADAVAAAQGEKAL